MVTPRPVRVARVGLILHPDLFSLQSGFVSRTLRTPVLFAYSIACGKSSSHPRWSKPSKDRLLAHCASPAQPACLMMAKRRYALRGPRLNVTSCSFSPTLNSPFFGFNPCRAERQTKSPCHDRMRGFVIGDALTNQSRIIPVERRHSSLKTAAASGSAHTSTRRDRKTLARRACVGAVSRTGWRSGWKTAIGLSVSFVVPFRGCVVRHSFTDGRAKKKLESLNV